MKNFVPSGGSVSRLLNQLFDNKTKYRLSALDIKRVRKQEHVCYVLAIRNRKLIGMAALYQVDLFSRRLGVIEEVVVVKKWRSKGIGREMVEILIARGQKLGLDCIELNYRLSDTKTARFYRRMGFRSRKNGSMRLILNKSHFIV